MENTQKKIKVIVPGQDSYFMQEAIKVIRTNLEFCGRDIKTIAFTSYGENEGKTTVSVFIAKSLAELGKKVLFVDADMRKSVFAVRNTDSTDYSGLSEVLSGIKALDECIRETTQDGLYILQSGKYPPNPVELINSKYFEDLIVNSKQIFDYVIIDTPPIGYTIDTAIISGISDGVVIIIGDPNLKRRQAKSMMTQLSKANCHILGLIRNNIKRQSKKRYR